MPRKPCSYEDRRYVCEECGSRFNEPSDLVRHTRRHTDERPYKCPECERSYRAKFDMQMHMRRHTGERPFSCEICGEKFMRQSVKDSHMRIHTDDKPFSCDLCEERFRIEIHLVRHRKRHFYPFTCPVCSERFPSKEKFQRHNGLHDLQRPYECVRCHKRYWSAKSLEAHEGWHVGAKPFHCMVCPKRFHLQKLLKRHMAVHETDITYTCQYCDKHYVNRLTFKDHLRRAHIESLHFVCNVCHGLFVDQTDLDVHVFVSHSHAERDLSAKALKLARKNSSGKVKRKNRNNRQEINGFNLVTAKSFSEDCGGKQDVDLSRLIGKTEDDDGDDEYVLLSTEQRMKQATSVGQRRKRSLHSVKREKRQLKLLHDVNDGHSISPMLSSMETSSLVSDMLYTNNSHHGSNQRWTSLAEKYTATPCATHSVLCEKLEQQNGFINHVVVLHDEVKLEPAELSTDCLDGNTASINLVEHFYACESCKRRCETADEAVICFYSH